MVAANAAGPGLAGWEQTTEGEQEASRILDNSLGNGEFSACKGGTLQDTPSESLDLVF